MNKTTKTLSLAVAMFAITGMTGAFSNQAFAGSTGEGTCSSGFWKNDDSKNDAENWPVKTDPLDLYENAMGGIDTELRTKGGNDDNPSLRDALNAKGGKENALAREAAAALLNIRSGFDYPITEADLVAAMLNAFDGTDDDVDQEELRAFLFDANHTESCPFENNEI